MSSIGASKRNLTKAITAWENVKGKIPPSALEPKGTQAFSTRSSLESHYAIIDSHAAQVRFALRMLVERRQAFQDLVKEAGDQDTAGDKHHAFLQNLHIDEAILTAQGLLLRLDTRMDELRALNHDGHTPIPSGVTQDVRSQQHRREHSAPTSSASTQTNFIVLPQRSHDASSLLSHAMSPSIPSQSGSTSAYSAVQLDKLTLEPFSGDITQFHRFWCTFELAVHSNSNISPVYKFLYLQGLLKDEAKVVLQDLDPDECNYSELVNALKRRYDRPHKTRATLHRQLQQLPVARNIGSDLRNTWFRLSGILHGLRRYEDFRSILPIIDLVKGKFPAEIQQKLHDLEFQSQQEFDLDQIMKQLDNIIASKEKFEDSTTFIEDRTVGSSSHQRSSSCSPAITWRSPTPSRCCFCESEGHRSTRCTLQAPVAIRRALVRASNLCWRCLCSGHTSSSCSHSPCRTCRQDHHDLLCDQHSQSHHSPSEDKRSSDSYHRHRSRSYSRSPSRDRRRSCSQSRSNRSYSYPRRGDESRSYHHSPRSSQLHPQRVTSCSPVRNSPSHHRCTVLPHPQLNQSSQSDDEAERMLSFFESTRSSEKPLRFATLMLIEGLALNCNTTRFEKVTLFLDSGAQASFITQSLANRLGLKVTDCRPRTFTTFGGHSTTEVSGIVQVTLKDLLEKEFVLELTTKQTVTVAQFPPRLSSEDLDFLYDQGLSLPFHQSQPVVPGILIGIDHFWDILSPERPICLPSGMVLSHTRFGTVVSGNSVFSSWLTQDLGAVDTIAVAEREDNPPIERLWSLDSIGILDDHHTSADAKLQERILQDFNTSACLVDGVLYVCFPWKTDHPPLDDNKQLAYCRLSSQYQRLSQNPSVWQQYVKAIEDHVTAGFVEEVEEFVFDDPRIYYIPHQAVYKETSATTKLRVVFDASSKRKGAYSLNDCLHQGPTLLPDLVGILLRARLHRFLLIADVEKAFHQVRLQRSERDACRFLWLKDPFKPPSPGNMRILRFTRIPFGVNASPFLLAAAIRLYLRREASSIGDEISRNTYVDNVILGAASREGALSKYKLLKSVFGRMHMNLREFLCNSSVVNSSIAPQDRAVDPSKASLLGVRWIHNRDAFAITIKTAHVSVTTKRTALSALASTYDPFGLLTPFLSPAKVFIQDLWMKDMSWDTPLDKSQLERWRQLISDLKHPLPQIRRLVLPSNSKPSSLELCVFGDASKRLYACCAYLVCRKPDAVHSSLLMAKSHLNTPKPITIPRLELLAALVSIRMTQYLVKHLNLPIIAIHLFLDSLIALHWIHARKTFKVFVQNRVEAIRRIVAEIEAQGIPVKFHYVASEENPADCATRGLATKEAQNHMWWSGPHFLHSPPSQWPNAHVDFQIPPLGGESMEEQHSHVCTIQQGEFRSVLPFHRTNNYLKLVRITIYVLKFLRRYIFDRVSQDTRDTISQKLPCVEAVLSSSALDASDAYTAERQLILAHYREGESILQRLKLADLKAERAQDHLIRCSSRIGPPNQAPILLLPTHRLTYIIILHYHILNHHSGVTHTTANLRLRFFIPSIRTHVGKVIRKCVACKNNSGHAYRYPDIPQLPPERVKRSRPFQNIAVDYLGPLTVSNAVVSSTKVWICLLTCMATRAVHLEVVLDNSTQEFLLAFRRFVARRGAPDVVYSDNSTTFHAAESGIVSVLYSSKSWEKIAEYCLKHRIDWKFMTPLSPWKGGFYERLVAMFKNAYKKSIGRIILPLNHLQTVVVEIEAMLNSRPITQYSERDVFAHALRPADFILPHVNFQLPPLQSAPDPVFDVSHNLARWYKDMLVLLDQFWDIWHSHYLAALRERHQTRIHQGKFTTTCPQVGDIVIIADEKLPRGHWPYGLIEELHRSKDARVKSAKVRMPNGKSKICSISNLYPLEIRASSQSTDVEPAATTPANRRIQPPRSAKTTHKFVRAKTA